MESHQCISPSPGATSGVVDLPEQLRVVPSRSGWELSLIFAFQGGLHELDPESRAAWPPIFRRPSVRFSSKPIHTPAVRVGEKPTNQAIR